MALTQKNVPRRDPPYRLKGTEGLRGRGTTLTEKGWLGRCTDGWEWARDFPSLFIAFSMLGSSETLDSKEKKLFI